MRRFQPGKDWVWYAPNTRDVYGEKEIRAAGKTLRAGWLTTGPATAAFEKKIAKLYGKKYGLFVNSGSSANLLALTAFNFPKGSEVITPACNFNTTVAPIVQLGLVPVFVDIGLGTYTLDPKELPKALSKKTVAIMVPHLVGNIADLSRLRAFARKHKLVVIEDSCDTIGATYKGKRTGAYTDITTTSFYASHMVTTAGAGGMVMTNDAKLREKLRVLRDWGRGITAHDEKIRSRLSAFSIGGASYDSAFAFVLRGYMMRPTEVQAAFGLAQLTRLPSIIKKRADVFKRIRAFLARYEDRIILPETENGARTSWLAFPITFREDSGIDRNAFARFLEDRKIQTRPLFSGNITKHPAYKGVGRKVGTLSNSDAVLKNALLIGAHHGLTAPMLAHLFTVIDSFMKKRS